ncbi:hypothetical protein ACHAWO_004643 [Cyclotella atomus]|uniref:Uncharacterized protein n=1 Tax=Cyclotella atomus TaxID=382360 RepID=A0ABD3MRR3_9STRA
MIRFYGQDMIDTTTNRFYYYCHPQEGTRMHVHMPLRDMAAAWDGTKAIEYLSDKKEYAEMRQSLIDAVRCTVDFYLQSLSPMQQNCLIPSKEILLEPVNIGHSALLLLAMCNSLELNIIEDHEIHDVKNAIDGLTSGIILMQLDNGAFSTYFGDDDFHKGIAFFPGEAMLALVTAYKFELLDPSRSQAVLQTILSAFDFYSNYHDTGDADMNYNIWQVIAFSGLYDCLNDQREKQTQVATYILTMCQEICQSKSWKYQLARGQSFYVNLETVEIACGLDALVEGISVATLEQEIELVGLFERNAANAIQFLSWMQSHVPESCVVGRGGLGYGGVCVLEQRLDVTGHAISALTKLQKLPH